MRKSIFNVTEIFFCLCLLLVPLPSFAYDLGDYLSINGFLSQGYIHSSDNNIFGESKDGSFQLNEFALTLNSTPMEKLRLSLQLLSRDLGKEGDNDILIDWAMADYRLTDSFGVRLGKVKLPVGLYNQHRDSDFLRPMAFLPQSVYTENKRTMHVGAWGGSIYGNISLGHAGDLDYQAYYGKVDFRDDSGQAVGMESLIKKTSMQQGWGPVTSFDSENEYVTGGSLIYNLPVDGLRLGFSYFTGKSEFDFTAGGFDGKASGNSKDFVVFSLEYTGPNWTFASEYTEFTGDRKVASIDVYDGRSQGGYVQLCYHLHESVAVSVLYDVVYADKDDRDGDRLEASGLPDYFGWRKDFGTAIRWDITDRWMVRAEYHNIDGAGLGLSIYNSPSVPDRYWDYYVLKTSYNF
ncbi:hypothetical protein SAMN02745165_00686 [Malonomonas rubra DSM 5091]|uniref:Uncharacterized protein n=1 Tax=Malonomonas rubra DSM 5091 TaxID=1122189 RepID=A0A1M6DHC9_MALRU|nr:hypothetical protein [Malonomonas rubra]SHI72767.1 hypothetical protein SAMN02745165_00686 [Malonomonas rubra DSM 5091]